MKRLLLLIATEKGYTALKRLIDKELTEHVGCVVTFHETNVQNDWSGDIAELSRRNNIPIYFWNEVKSELLGLIKKHEISAAVTISWKYLLPTALNDILTDKLIVFHDSLLPKYRGFAPTPTAIICGEETIGVTAIYAVESMDEGDIICQKEVHIPHDMYMDKIITKQAEACADILETILRQMEENAVCSFRQDNDQASYSIWRNPEDCHIDWNGSAEQIYNFVRALGSPYPGAYTFVNDEKVIIERTEVLNYDLNFAIRDPGKIWKISHQGADIICGSGILRVLKAKRDGDLPFVFDKVRCRLK